LNHRLPARSRCLLAAQRTPTPPAPPTARLSRRVLARTAARGAGHGSCSRSSPHETREEAGAAPSAALRSAYNSGKAKQRPTTFARAGSPKEASRRPAALPYRGLYAVARTRRASRPGANQSQPGPTKRGQTTLPAPDKCVGVPPSQCWSGGAACATNRLRPRTLRRRRTVSANAGSVWKLRTAALRCDCACSTSPPPHRADQERKPRRHARCSLLFARKQRARRHGFRCPPPGRKSVRAARKANKKESLGSPPRLVFSVRESERSE